MFRQLFNRLARILRINGAAPGAQSAVGKLPVGSVTVGKVDFVYPWRPLPQGGFEDRLDIEVSEGHPLWGESLRVIGRSEASDDIAIVLADGRYAIVHLTWDDKPGDMLFPETTFYGSSDEFSKALRDWWADVDEQ